ncbi:Homeobox KN domain [Aspergillus oryzae]|uniref:Homeobox KN domain n=1 Tax=Aspergillus oryzae TaxID=5062 RepID=A0A1S9DLA3_ASPOZ|nr:Homeobox KN domain [Aspergillus oryzae]
MSQPRELGKGSEKMAISYASGLPADHTQVLPSFRELLPPHLHDEIDSTSYYAARQNSRERPASAHRDMTSNPRPLSGDFGHFQPQLARNTPQYPSRGPSPILPPIRDLQQGLNASTAPFPDARGLSKLDPFGPATQDFRGTPAGAPGFSSANRPRPMDIPQGLSHTQPSNFGILGDPIDSKNKRRRGNLPKPVTDILRAWFHEHLDHPYPSEEDKQMFMTRTGLTISQISNWFINARRRQLPALRNQMRTGGSDLDSQRQSPFSDVDHASSESMPSPSQLASAR